jgi:surface polysaccharide O-acyltransferase-like enzyme
MEREQGVRGIKRGAAGAWECDGHCGGSLSNVRNHSIDAFRVVANLGVICVHTGPFMGAAFDPGTRFYGELLNQFVRVATPFFFLAAGYFFGASLARGASALPLAAKLVKRLMLFFLFWSAVYVMAPIELYMAAPEAGYWTAVHIMVSRVLSPHFLLNGTKVHMWFLPALSISLALLAIACRFRLERWLMGLAIALYVVGLLAGAYKSTPLGFDLGMNTRNGPFFAAIFVVSGFMIYRRGLQVSLAWALGLIAGGVVLRIVELYWITGRYDTPPSGIDYLLGTYPFGVGIFFLMLSTKRLGEVGWMVRLSRYSAGVYCAHILIVELLKMKPPDPSDPLWEIARPFVALVLSFALVMSMSKVRVLRPVVS